MRAFSIVTITICTDSTWICWLDFYIQILNMQYLSLKPSSIYYHIEEYKEVKVSTVLKYW